MGLRFNIIRTLKTNIKRKLGNNLTYNEVYSSLFVKSTLLNRAYQWFNYGPGKMTSQVHVSQLVFKSDVLIKNFFYVNDGRIRFLLQRSEEGFVLREGGPDTSLRSGQVSQSGDVI